MRWPIRNQIFLPVATLLLVAIASIAVLLAAVAARNSSQERMERVEHVVATLDDASFPFSENVLTKMRGLSGAEYVTLDDRGAILTSTLGRSVRESDLPSPLPATGHPARLEDFGVIDVGGQPYYMAVLQGHGNAGVQSLLILYPKSSLWQAEWEAAWPPLAIGGVTILLMVAVSAWLSRRLARRIEAVQGLFARIADGDFSHVNAQRPLDEVYELILSANRLSDRLAANREEIARTERLRLLAQLAGGLAHQLRNAVTGARMAVQLHQRRCPRGAAESSADESLDVALRQLTLTEEHVRGLLSLGKPDQQPPVPQRLSQIVAEVDRLVSPAAKHAHVVWECESPLANDDLTVTNAQSVRAGLLNLVLNAVQAVGNDGHVRLWTERNATHVQIHVVDSGSGPPDSLRSAMFEPFITSKPEGIGLGLALAKAAAEEHGGDLSFARIEGQTRFTMSLSSPLEDTAQFWDCGRMPPHPRPLSREGRGGEAQALAPCAPEDECDSQATVANEVAAKTLLRD
jgi:signal transduction histidine kinase